MNVGDSHGITGNGRPRSCLIRGQRLELVAHSRLRCRRSLAVQATNVAARPPFTSSGVNKRRRTQIDRIADRVHLGAATRELARVFAVP